MTEPVPQWAQDHLLANLPAGSVVNATTIGSRRVLANTRKGAVLVRRAFFGGVSHTLLEMPKPRIHFPCERCGETVHSFAHPPAEISCEGCGTKYVAAADGTVTNSRGVRVRTQRQPTAPAPRTSVDEDATTEDTAPTPTSTTSTSSTMEWSEPQTQGSDDGQTDGSEESEADTAVPKSDYRPQCVALTSDGQQCRNSARGGSRYCASHKGYQPPGAKGVAALLDTSPGHDSSGDRLLSVRGRAGAIIPGEQCEAITAAGSQCRNTARSGSKYCPSHRSYQPPTVRLVAARKDTTPRFENAPDTLPAVRKSSKKR